MVGVEYNRIILDLFFDKRICGGSDDDREETHSHMPTLVFGICRGGDVGDEEGVDAPAGWVMDNGVPRLIGRIKAKCGRRDKRGEKEDRRSKKEKEAEGDKK
jgi:hypothetical protein